MPINVCSICGERPRGRMASIYWSSWTGDGDRDAWKQRFDKEHYSEMASDWLDAARASWNATGARNCLLCDATDYADLAECYATLFVPGEDAARFTVTACLKHMPEVMKKARLGSERLPDRAGVMNGGARATGW